MIIINYVLPIIFFSFFFILGYIYFIWYNNAKEEGLIAGRLSSNTQQTGEILINGHKVTLAFGTSVRTIYKDQLV